MRVGDKVTEIVETIGKTLTGMVVYIHPEGRYYTAEFRTDKGRFRECFMGPERRGIP